ncbi:hypothetical protein [Methanopyrus kandleri]
MKKLSTELLRGLQRKPPTAKVGPVAVVPTERTLVTELCHLLRDKGYTVVAEVALPGTRYRPDLLLVDERPVILEAKRPGSDLPKHRDQAMKYVRVLLELHPELEPAVAITDFTRALTRPSPTSEWEKAKVRNLEELADLLIDLASR